MHACWPMESDCPSTLPKCACTQILHTWLRHLRRIRKASKKEMYGGQLCLLLHLPMAVRRTTVPSSKSVRQCGLATKGQAGHVRQGLWLPAMPCVCNGSNGPKSDWPVIVTKSLAASSLQPSYSRPSPSLIPPVLNTSIATISCADAPFSSLHCLPPALRCLAEHS